MLCKRWRNTNDELVPGSFIFVPGFRDKEYQLKTKLGQMARFLKKYLSKNNKLYQNISDDKERQFGLKITQKKRNCGTNNRILIN
jgi:hypothetical protein